MADTGEPLKVTIDGVVVEAEPGEWLIATAERHGVYIPRFCYHPRMRPVGMCRMCLVEIDTGRGPALQAACTVPSAAGMVVSTESAAVRKAQDGVLEFLLVNHPLDCPVCDKGGECPLQDQTVAFGPGESRFVEEKAHWEKPIPISSLVDLDRERCILCDRCTRFADEVAGDRLISFLERGSETEVNTYPDDPFTSYFSGNTVQICPVGALLARPYRFRARPWDLEQAESTCTSCSVGCRVAVQSSSNRVVRYLGIDVDPVNWGWLCDKGRFDFEALNSPERLATPLLRRGDDLVGASWAESMAAAADGLRQAIERHGADSVAVLGGARLTNEDAYAWAKLAKAVIGTDHVDAQMGDGLPADAVVGLPRATIDQACAAPVVVVLAADLKEELPVLYLRLRDAVLRGATRVIELAPRATALTPLAEISLRYLPGEAHVLTGELLAASPASPASPADGDLARARGLLAAEGTPAEGVVCVLGRPSVAEAAASVTEAAAALVHALPGARILSALRRANVHGALDMGLAPGLLPGRVSLEGGRAWFQGAWGSLPAATGLDATGILTAAAEGRIQGLVLLGADPLADFPDRDLARRGLAGAGFVVAVDCFATDSVRQADVVLPAAAYAEKSGTTTNLEGRISRLAQKVTPPGTARADWMIAVELAERLGTDLGFESLEGIWAEVERLAPAHHGVTGAVLDSAGCVDGVVVPVTGPLPAVASMRPAQTEAPAEVAVDLHTGHQVTQPQATSSEAAPQGSGTATGDLGDDGGLDDADGLVVRPALLAFEVEGAPSPPAADSYSLRLVSHRKLYDAGTLVQHSPSLAMLAPGATVRAHPVDLDRLGVGTGAPVRVKAARGSLVMDVTADPDVARGTAVVWFNQPGTGAADLIDVSTPVTDVRLERLDP